MQSVLSGFHLAFPDCCSQGGRGGGGGGRRGGGGKMLTLNILHLQLLTANY